MIDLHTHTVFSDGSMTPRELVDEAVKYGSTHLSVTDHDTISGINEAIEHSKEVNGPEIITGIEFSCHHKREDIHILAYYIPLDNPALNGFLESKYAKREERFRCVIDKLAKLGFPIKPDDVKAYAPGGMKMAPQIVKVLFDKNFIKSEKEAKHFVREYLMPGKKAYVEHGDNPDEIISFFHNLGSVTSLAHPNKIHDFSIVCDVISMGIDGLEFYYPNIIGEKRKKLALLIKENQLIATGGSDFHGVYSDSKLGSGNVPQSVLKDIQKALKSLKKMGTVPNKQI